MLRQRLLMARYRTHRIAGVRSAIDPKADIPVEVALPFHGRAFDLTLVSYLFWSPKLPDVIMGGGVTITATVAGCDFLRFVR